MLRFQRAALMYTPSPLPSERRVQSIKLPWRGARAVRGKRRAPGGGGWRSRRSAACYSSRACAPSQSFTVPQANSVRLSAVLCTLPARTQAPRTPRTRARLRDGFLQQPYKVARCPCTLARTRVQIHGGATAGTPDDTGPALARQAFVHRSAPCLRAETTTPPTTPYERDLKSYEPLEGLGDCLLGYAVYRCIRATFKDATATILGVCPRSRIHDGSQLTAPVNLGHD